MPDVNHPATLLTALDASGRKPYQPPVLHAFGDVISLTQVAYGGLSKNLFGFLFAQSSIGLPGPPGPPIR